MYIDYETIPDPHPRLEASRTEVIASRGTQTVGDGVEVGVGNNVVPKTQDVMNLIVMKYLSQYENYEDFAREIERMRKVLIVNAEPGCVIFTALCSSLKILDALWFDYCTGNLNDMAQKYLVTKDVLKRFGLTELKLTTTIQGEEYIAARKLFLRGSGEHIQSVLERCL